MNETLQLIIQRIREMRDELKILKTRQGDFSRTAKSTAINAGIITADHHDHFMLQPETGTTDDLVTINGISDGRRITLYPQDSGDTITVKNNTGNILLGADRVLANQYDTITLLYSASVGKWLSV